MLKIFKLICLALVLAFAGCGKPEIKFDKYKWLDGDGIDFKYRDAMLNDLMQNYHLKGMTYRQVLALLNQPQTKRPLMMEYEILVDHEHTKARYIKNLRIYFDKDSIVNRTFIYDYKAKD